MSLLNDINRLCAGYTFVDDYVIDIPSATTLMEADRLYEECLYKTRFDDIIDSSKTDFLLMKFGLWSVYEDSILKEIPKKLNAAKLSLFQNYKIPSRKKYAKQEINKLKRTYDDLTIKKNAFYIYTRQFIADQARERFIFSKILLDKNYKSIEVSPVQLEKIISDFKKNSFTFKRYREIARDDSWGAIWSALKTKAFRKIGEDQKQLISYTQFYENINKHPECPSDDIINDDDALDGWLLHIKAKQEKEKREKAFESTKGSDKATEQFVIAQNPEDVQAVLDMNDARGKVIQSKIHAMRKQQGVANEFNVQEIRQDATRIKR